jgi:hypothetical protein
MKKQARTTRGSGALPIAAGAPREGWAAAGASFVAARPAPPGLLLVLGWRIEGL